jgi:hypothetical protein
MARNFDKYDGPVNIDMDPEEALKLLLQQRAKDADSDSVQ